MAIIQGTIGADTISPNFLSSGVTGFVTGSDPSDIFGLDGNDDILWYGSNSGVYIDGGGGNDNLQTTESSADLLFGRPDPLFGSADTLFGGDGDDVLLAIFANGVTTLLGGEDNDALISYDSSAIMSGGSGRDTFTFGGEFSITISDFAAGDGGDTIDLSALSLFFNIPGQTDVPGILSEPGLAREQGYIRLRQDFLPSGVPVTLLKTDQDGGLGVGFGFRTAARLIGTRVEDLTEANFIQPFFGESSPVPTPTPLADNLLLAAAKIANFAYENINEGALKENWQPIINPTLTSFYGAAANQAGVQVVAPFPFLTSAVHAYIGNSQGTPVLAIGFRGTAEDNRIFSVAEIMRQPGNWDKYYEAHFDYLKALFEWASVNNHKVIVAGHSLGGILAEYLAADQRLASYTDDTFFVTFGSPGSPENAPSDAKIFNFVHNNDFVAAIDEDVGALYQDVFGAGKPVAREGETITLVKPTLQNVPVLGVLGSHSLGGYTKSIEIMTEKYDLENYRDFAVFDKVLSINAAQPFGVNLAQTAFGNLGVQVAQLGNFAFDVATLGSVDVAVGVIGRVVGTTNEAVNFAEKVKDGAVDRIQVIGSAVDALAEQAGEFIFTNLEKAYQGTIWLIGDFEPSVSVASGSAILLIDSNQDGEVDHVVRAPGTYDLSLATITVTEIGAAIRLDGELTLDSGFIIGSAGDDHLLGTSEADVVRGVAGNNIIEGFDGADVLFGGLGNDILDGGDGNDTLTAFFGTNSLFGGSGNDFLENHAEMFQRNEGGLGNDIVIGGLGSGGTWNNGGEGIDVIDYSRSLSGITLNLAASLAIGPSLFHDTLEGFENAIGTQGNDVIIGDGENNILEGHFGDDALNGGLGADTMIGGPGNDSYSVDDLGDVVIELPGEGIDTVRTTLTASTLGANFENLIFTGTGNFEGIGNDLANGIGGGAGDDILIGGEGNDRLVGGTGADGLEGGRGDDRFVVDQFDAVLEKRDEGWDTVVSRVSWDLEPHLENLRLLGTADISGTSNAQGSRIQGNAGNNFLQGLEGNDNLLGGHGADTLSGGLGNDRLVGGPGADLFLFAGSNDGLDRIIDFVSGEDAVVLSAGAFGLLPGASPDAHFVSHASNKATAAAGTPQIVYDTRTGNLAFDLDGVASGSAPIVFARFVMQSDAPTVSDFLFV